MENENIMPGNSEILSENKPAIPLRDAVFAWGALALGFIFTHFCVPYFGGICGGVFWALFGIGVFVYAKINGVKFSKFRAAMLIIAEIFCLTPLFSTNRGVCFLAAFFSFALYLLLLLSLSGAEPFGRHFVMDFIRASLVRPFANFAKQPVCAFSVFKGKTRSRNVLYALIGLILAVPLTVVVVALLASSDEGFKEMLNGFFRLLPGFSFRYFWEILFAVPIAMYLFGALFSMRDPAPQKGSEKAPGYRLLPPVVGYFAAAPICVFYLIYIIVQIGNIARVFGGNESSAEYSQFARNGFFELCAIAVIDLCVIIVMQVFTQRDALDKKPVTLRVFSVMISALTLLIIATALIKMFMYIGELGMTLLRVYTSWFMVLLAFVFVLVIVLQFKEFPIWKTLFIGFTALFAVLCFGNFEGRIANYNISAYQSGIIEELDVYEFYELGTAAVEPAWELYNDCDDELTRIGLAGFLEYQLGHDLRKSKIAYFSVPRAGAQKALEEAERNGVIDEKNIDPHDYMFDF